MLQGYPRLRDMSGLLSGYSRVRNAVGMPLGLPNGARRLDLTHPLALGLVGWWPLDEGQGIVARDLSIYANRGTLTSMADPATATSGWGAGASQRELAFDGSNDHVSVPHSSSLSVVGDMTMTAWIRIAAWNWHMLMTKTNGGTAGPYSAYVNLVRGTIEFHRGNGAAAAYVESTTALALNTWQFVAVTMAGTAVQHYLNAATAGSGTLSTAIADSGNAMQIGRRTDGFYVGGQLVQCRLYNRALSAAEISQIYADRWAGSIGGIQ